MLLRNFASMLIKLLAYNFFFIMPLSSFGIRVMLGLYNELGSLSFSAMFWISVRSIGVHSSLNILKNSPVKPFYAGLLFVRSFILLIQFY